MKSSFLDRHPNLDWLWRFFKETRTDVPSEHIALMRFLVVIVLFIFGFLIIFVRNVEIVFFEQLPKHVARKTDQFNMVRGNVYDRNQQLLATTVLGHSLAVDPKKIQDPERTAQKLISVFPNLELNGLLRSFNQKRDFVYVVRDITPKQMAAVKNLALDGMIYEEIPHRVYPYGNLISHLLGTLNIDHQPQSGIEYGQNRSLIKLDNIDLSVDVRIQQILYTEIESIQKRFQAKGSAGIIMNIRNGEILAMVSLPDFDPNTPSAPDENRINRVTKGVYEMGSTFKIFNTALALELKTTRLESQFDVSQPIQIGNYTINDFEQNLPILTVEQIFIQSSNIGSGRMADQFTSQQQSSFLRSLGLLTAPSLEIPEIGGPILPKPWDRTQKITVSYGQGISVSMLQMVRATAAMVNGGILIKPTLLRLDSSEPVSGVRVISEDTSSKIRRLMRLAVAQGTGSAAMKSDYQIGGKTGTAQKVDPLTLKYSNSSVNASFIGVFPFEKPEYLVMILLDDPKGEGNRHNQNSAGKVAVPAVSSVISQIGPLLGYTQAKQP